MTTQIADTRPRQLLRSIGAVLLGFVFVFVTSLGTDQILHVLDVYPPWGEPMYETSDNLLALAYRTVYAIIGSYIMARFAPYAPMRHAMIGGAIGFVLSSMGAIAAISIGNLGPIWFPIALVLTALPCAWVGGLLHRKWHNIMIRVGIGGMDLRAWRGLFFPEKLPKTKELSHASRRVTSIEVNGTFYSTFTPSTFRRWAEETPDDFIFSLKAPRFAVNRRVLAEAGPSIEKFLASGVS